MLTTRTVVIITEADDCGPGGKMPKVISKCDKNNDYGEIILEGVMIMKMMKMTHSAQRRHLGPCIAEAHLASMAFGNY